MVSMAPRLSPARLKTENSCQSFSKNRRFDHGLILRLAELFRPARVQVLHTHHLGQLLYAVLPADWQEQKASIPSTIFTRSIAGVINSF